MKLSRADRVALRNIYYFLGFKPWGPLATPNCGGLQPKQDLEAKNRKKTDFEKFIDTKAAGKDLLQILNRKDQNYAFITFMISCGHEILSQDDRFRKRGNFLIEFNIFGTSEI